MTSIIVSTLFVLSAGEYFYDQADQAMSQVVGWVEVGRSAGTVEFRRSEDLASLTVVAYRFAPTLDVNECWKRQTLFNAAYRDANLPFSNIPLGMDSRRFDGVGPDIYSYNRRAFVRIYVTYRGSGNSGHIVWRNENKATDKVDVEGVARRILAAVAGKDSTALSNTTVGGQSIPRRQGAEGVALVPLSSWCTVRGVELVVNNRLGTASFFRNGHTVVVALGARAMKVGSEWRELGDTIALHDGKWYVPFNALEQT